MKAVVCDTYGPPDVLRIDELEKPVPKDRELLVKVNASTASAGVLWVRNGKHPSSRFFSFMIRVMFGFKKPKNPVLGYEFAGEVEMTGRKVSFFKKGDKVFGTTTGLKQGSYAEFVCIPERWGQGVVATMPDTLSFEQAAAVPIGGMTALHILKKADLNAGKKILIYRASGSVGTFAVQIARSNGAEVTGVCGTSNTGLIKSIGADRVIDYLQEDFTASTREYDVVFDAVGKISRSLCSRVLKKDGVFS